jgi:hypothetical protein
MIRALGARGIIAAETIEARELNIGVMQGY